MTGSKELNVTHQQMADELGSSREVISRLLKQLEKRRETPSIPKQNFTSVTKVTVPAHRVTDF